MKRIFFSFFVYSGYELFETVIKSIGSTIPLIVEDIGDVTIDVFQLRDYFHFYGIRILQMGFYTYPDNIYSKFHCIYGSHFLTIFFSKICAIKPIGSHDNPTAIEWWKEIASQNAKDQFLEYIHRPFVDENEFIDGLELKKHVDKYISWYFIQIILQSSSNGAIILMQDLLNIQIRMNYPGTGLILSSTRFIFHRCLFCLRIFNGR